MSPGTPDRCSGSSADAIGEVAPVALLGLDDSLRLEMAVPDGFPLVLATRA